MTAANQWVAAGKVRKNSLLRCKATLKTKTSGATAVVGDYYEFPCVAKTLLALADSPTWNVVTDDPADLTGRTYVGKPENVEPIELTTETVLPMIFNELNAHRLAGDVFELEFKYDDPKEAKIYSMTIDDCEITSIKPEAGETNDGSKTVIVFQPEGGASANLCTFVETART